MKADSIVSPNAKEGNKSKHKLSDNNHNNNQNKTCTFSHNGCKHSLTENKDENDNHENFLCNFREVECPERDCAQGDIPVSQILTHCHENHKSMETFNVNNDEASSFPIEYDFSAANMKQDSYWTPKHVFIHGKHFYSQVRLKKDHSFQF
jgi:hypothetical protein